MVWWSSIGRKILIVEVPPEEWRSQPQPGSPAQGINAGKRNLYNIWLWIPAGIAFKRDKGLPETKTLLLKCLYTDFFAHKLIRSKLQSRGSSSKSSRDILIGTKLTKFRARAGMLKVVPTLFRDGTAVRHHCSFVEISASTGPMLVGTKCMLSINVIDTINPILEISWEPVPLNLLTQPDPLPGVPPHKQWLASVCIIDPTKWIKFSTGFNSHCNSHHIFPNLA